ncbi:hypothetical protein [Nostoc sp.]|uniref:hypothetical protein n=1 Tax=Nostoc sp. TaxID=1180 RepID=UPI002FF593FB
MSTTGYAYALRTFPKAIALQKTSKIKIKRRHVAQSRRLRNSGLVVRHRLLWKSERNTVRLRQKPDRLRVITQIY